MVEKLENPSLEKNPLGEAACIHHWLIETPNGPTSPGTCKKCGDERPFVNYQGDDNYFQKHFRGELETTEKQKRNYYHGTGVISEDPKRVAESILPKNGTIGGRF